MKSLLVPLLIAAAVLAAPVSASRAPSYLEKISIMDAFNIPGRSFSSRCVRIVVSTVDPRWAYVTSPKRPAKACVDAGEVGDGWSLYHRANRTSLHWVHVIDGDGVPCQPPPAVRRDLFGSSVCQ